MYQSVDDIEDDGQKPEKPAQRKKLVPLVLTAIVLLALIAFFLPKEEALEPEEVETGAEIYAVYTKAISEPQPALRRARLLDFIGNYPKHDRVSAAKAQLSVIQNADDQAWLSVQEIIYDPRQGNTSKLAALELYDEMWSSVLLGGREAELSELRERLESGEDLIIGEVLDGETTEASDLEKQDFTPPPDVFDASIDGTQLAGAVPVYEPVIRPEPVRRRVIQRPMRSVIKQPTIKKDRKPSYPSRARRRGVEAEIVLLLNIDDEGEVQMTEVVSASARRYRKDFIRAAERAAMRTEFYPKTINGKPVAAMGIIKKYRFIIR